jgi:hypothetical protein
MNKKVEDYLILLLKAGFDYEQIKERGYDYALTLLTDELPQGAYIPSAMKLQAAEALVKALPEAYRTYEINKRMR